jgi:hypothetical protein
VQSLKIPLVGRQYRVNVADRAAMPAQVQARAADQHIRHAIGG